MTPLDKSLCEIAGTAAVFGCLIGYFLGCWIAHRVLGRYVNRVTKRGE